MKINFIAFGRSVKYDPVGPQQKAMKLPAFASWLLGNIRSRAPAMRLFCPGRLCMETAETRYCF